MKPVWITIISVAAALVQGVLLLTTGATGVLLVASLLNVVR